eukprot:7679002-Ditylum_brightwellii.AAC.1
MKYKTTDGQLKYVGKLGNGQHDREGVTHRWVQHNVRELFPENYYCLKDTSIYHQFQNVPEGYIPCVGEPMQK